MNAQIHPDKKCLIVAIGEYQNLKRISSEKDIPLIRTALEKQGFKDFRILQDSLATKKNILIELSKLEKDANPGDVIVIHFSAHGQGIPDDNNDEPDGVDESICCYGAEQYISESYRGEEHLRDDLLGEKLDRIRLKTGAKGQLLVLLDACFSGSGTRGGTKVSRGIGNLLTKKGEKVNRSIQDGLTFANEKTVPGSGKLSPLTVFSASRADELNYEYEGQGSLSFAFNKALTNNSGSETSFRSLFAGIISTMSTIVPYQNPVAEGEGIDLTVFGTGLISSPLYFTAEEFDREENLVKLSAGMIAGIYPSSTVAFYPSGVPDTTGRTPLFTGEVISSGSLSSVVKTMKLPSDIMPQGVWCWMKKEAIPLNTVKIAISREVLPLLPTEFIEDLKKFKMAVVIESLDDCDISIEKAEAPGLFRIVVFGTGTILLDATRDADKMKRVIKNFTKARLFESMNLSNPDISPGMELIPVKFDKEKKKITDTLQIKCCYKEGVLTANEDNYFMIKIKNTGEKRAFFNIVSIDENYRIMLLIPWLKKNENPANYFIEPGTEFIIPNFIYHFKNTTGFNYTSETLKIIFTTRPLDLRYAFMRSAGENPGQYQGNSSILEELMKMDDEFMSRGGLTAPEDEEISTFTLMIRKQRK